MVNAHFVGEKKEINFDNETTSRQVKDNKLEYTTVALKYTTLGLKKQSFRNLNSQYNNSKNKEILNNLYDY
jgi:hypothetical protein